MEAYDEATCIRTLRQYIPRPFPLYRFSQSLAKTMGTMVLGTAEGEVKIIIHNATSTDKIDINSSNEYAISKQCIRVRPHPASNQKLQIRH